MATIVTWQDQVRSCDVLGRSLASEEVRPLSKPLRFMLSINAPDPIFVADCADAEDAACLLVNTSDSELWRLLHHHKQDNPVIWLSR